MEGFNYTNIFETKGIEYIAIIAFLILLIPFWMILNNKSSFLKQIRNVLTIFSFDNLKVPQGISYGRNHTWAFMEKYGLASIGLDDFLLRAVGKIKLNMMKETGEMISRGELMIEIVKENKVLKIFSPISGKIEYSNSILNQNPDLINTNPYGQGWIYRIKPSNWKEETNLFYMAEEATEWSKKELVRFKDFIAASSKKYSPEMSLIILQDGGELVENTLSILPKEVWQDFQESFLNNNT